MNALPDREISRIVLIDDSGMDRDVTKFARRYVAIRQKAVRANLAWLETGDDADLQMRDNYLYRSVEIVTTIRDLLGHDASKRIEPPARFCFGPNELPPCPGGRTCSHARFISTP
ncbi:MAG: hypothetical protein M3490_04800 [Chloroflexota bacterium]|nr:hypothetical protein [Chloroflexota bacterium]